MEEVPLIPIFQPYCPIPVVTVTSHNSSLHLLFNNVWFFTGSIPGYIGRRYKRNGRAQTTVAAHATETEVQRSRVHAPNARVGAIEEVRRQGPPNARTQAQKCILTTQHSSYYKSIHIVIAKINVQNSKPYGRQLS